MSNRTFEHYLTTHMLAERREKVKQHNLKLLEELRKYYNLPQIPEKVATQVEMFDQRIAKIIALDYDAFDAKFVATAMRDSTATKLDGRDPKTSYPYLYLYCPEIASVIQEKKEKEQRERNVRNILARFTPEITKLPAEQMEPIRKRLAEFVRGLPVEVESKNIMFEGSRKKVIKMGTGNNSKLYGDPNSDVFAAEYQRRYEGKSSVPALSIFVPELTQYKKEFAEVLHKMLVLPLEIADRISAALEHDTFYSVKNSKLYFDFCEYVDAVTAELKLQSPGQVSDLLQGDVEVKQLQLDSTTSKTYVNINIDAPSAFLVGNRIFVFLPSMD